MKVVILVSLSILCEPSFNALKYILSREFYDALTPTNSIGKIFVHSFS